MKHDSRVLKRNRVEGRSEIFHTFQECGGGGRSARLSTRASPTEKLFQCLSGAGEGVNLWRLFQTEHPESCDLPSSLGEALIGPGQIWL